MPRDVNGNVSLPTNDSSPAAPRNVIRSSDFNELMGDISTMMQDSLSRSGKGGMTADLDMDGNDVLNAPNLDAAITTANGAAQKSANLSDLASAAVARENLDLGVPGTSDHLFQWGDLLGHVYDGVSDTQAYFGQTQPTFLANGSLGAIYGQRVNSYTGGAAGDSTTPACGAVRGYNQVNDTVTYCNESGGLFVTDSYSWLGQAAGVFGQANSRHGGRAWGVLGEAKELPEVYTATAGQTVFVVPNGFNAIGAVTRNGSSVAYTPSSPNVTLTVAASAGDIVKIYRANPQNAFMGAEIGVYGAAGNDDTNLLSGNRVVIGVFAYRSDSSMKNGPAVRIGTGVNIVSDPADSTLTVDRGVNFQGRFKNTIDFTASNLVVTDYLVKFTAAGAGIDKDMNMSLGASAPTAVAGYTTFVIANLTNGGMLRVTDGTALARFTASVGGGVVLGSESAHDVLLWRNGTERLRIGSTSVTIRNGTSGGLLFATDGTATGRMQAAVGSGIVFGSDTGHDVIFTRSGTERMRIGSTALQLKLDALATPIANTYLVVQATSNTSLTFKYQGSDGTVRSASLTLA